MSYKEEIMNEVDSETGEHKYEHLAENVFFQKVYAKDYSGKYKFHTLADVLTKMGQEDKYMELLGMFVYRTRPALQKEHPKIAILGLDEHFDRLEDNPDKQQLLWMWFGHPETGDRDYNGGVLFHHGKISTHT